MAGLVVFVRKGDCEIMSFEFDKVSYGVNASESIELVSFGRGASSCPESPRTDGVNVDFFPGRRGSLSRSQESVLPGMFLVEFASFTFGCNIVDGRSKFGMVVESVHGLKEGLGTSCMDGHGMVPLDEVQEHFMG